MKHIILITATLILGALTTTVQAGDAAAGKAVYMQCQACHGANGEGNEALKAPKVAGQYAWYIVSSLKQYKEGGRNYPAAATMVPFATMLNDTQKADVAAYIASMK